MTRRWLVALAALVGLASVESEAQNSVYGVLGIGFPGRSVSTRARATGGGISAFDARSPLSPAPVAGFRRITVLGEVGTSLWNYAAGDTTVDGLSQTRSPLGMLGGWFRGTPISFALSYTTYAERTWNMVTQDSIVIRDEPMAVQDVIQSDGGINDIRAALAYRLSSRLSVGAGFHLLSGSSQLTTERNFSSPNYIPFLERNEITYSGIGVSAGIVATVNSRLTVSLAFRADDELRIAVDSGSVSRFNLPHTYIGGVVLSPVPAIRLASTVVRKTWSYISEDLGQIGGANAFDTWDVGTGLEIGGTPETTKIPLLLGFRYAQLPFSPNSEQPREYGFSGGSTLGLAADRVLFDFAVERIFRSGGGAEERSWFLTFALTVRP